MKSQKQGTLIVIAGPTAIGKTHLSIEIAEHFNTQIISADSRQMYRELKIGTACPTKEHLNRVPHHFIGNLSITEYYNASMYEVSVLELLDNLFKKHHIVVLTGGSGMYIDAITKGIDDLPTIDPEIRKNLL